MIFRYCIRSRSWPGPTGSPEYANDANADDHLAVRLTEARDRSIRICGLDHALARSAGLSAAAASLLTMELQLLAAAGEIVFARHAGVRRQVASLRARADRRAGAVCVARAAIGHAGTGLTGAADAGFLAVARVPVIALYVAGARRRCRLASGRVGGSVRLGQTYARRTAPVRVATDAAWVAVIPEVPLCDAEILAAAAAVVGAATAFAIGLDGLAARTRVVVVTRGSHRNRTRRLAIGLRTDVPRYERTAARASLCSREIRTSACR